MTGLLFFHVKCKSTGKIQILPELYEVPVFLTSATKNFYGESDLYDEQRSGYDKNEIFGIRTYQKGDRLQNVHWKLSAKQDELMVKEESLPKSCPVVLFLNPTSMLSSLPKSKPLSVESISISSLLP